MAPRAEEPMWEKMKEIENPITKDQPKTKYKYVQIAQIVYVHTFSLYALLFKIHLMQIWTILYSVVLVMLAVLGTTAGVHRLWSHRSFKATLPLRVFLFGCFALCSHASIYNWVQLHRIHHKYADTDADPHNSRRGFFFSHIGWYMVDLSPECREKKKEVDMSDILNEPLATFHSRYFSHISYTLMLLPSLVPVFLWGEDPFLSFLASGPLRYFGSLHCVVSINSFAHMYGVRPYNKKIQPVENALVSILALGEGWHNYHHTFPWDYKAGEFGDRLNLTARFINLCAKVGLAYDLKTVSPDMIAKVKSKNGDGSHVY